MSVLYKIKDLDLRILRMFQSDGNKLCDRLTPSQIRIITYLCENKVLYQKDIEKKLNELIIDKNVSVGRVRKTELNY